MTRPGFLSTPMPPAPAKPSGPVRCGSYGVAVQAAPWRYRLLHDSEEDVLLWITRGQGRVIVNGLRRGVSMHSALYLPAGALFSINLPTTAQALILQCPSGMAAKGPDSSVMLRVLEPLAQAELTGSFDDMRRETTYDRSHLQ